MFGNGLASYYNVIDVAAGKLDIPKDAIHYFLKDRGGIFQSKGHHYPLQTAVTAPECSFVAIDRLNLYLVEALTQIKYRRYLLPAAWGDDPERSYRSALDSPRTSASRSNDRPNLSWLA